MAYNIHTRAGRLAGSAEPMDCFPLGNLRIDVGVLLASAQLAYPIDRKVSKRPSLRTQ
jgi:hypothetical protein